MDILLVDDDELIVEELKAEITARIAGSRIIAFSSFSDAVPVVERSHFDAVVLDLYEGDPRPESLRGGALWQEIWRHAFVPVIVHTGGDEFLEPAPPADHPFVAVLRKSGGSARDVVTKLEEVRASSQALRVVYQELRQALSTSLRDAVPALMKVGVTAPDALALLPGIGRRRVAARLDLDSVLTGAIPRPSERYVYPRLEGTNLLLGDILRRRADRTNNAEDYFVVLTPSCDLVQGEGRHPVNSVLLAHCRGMEFFSRKESLPQNEANLRARLPGALRSPKTMGVIFLPELPGVFPNMVADVRDLQLIPLAQITESYEPIASVDSPFREDISWTFIQSCGRPAMPDHDFTSCVDGIVRSLLGQGRVAEVRPEIR